VDTISAGSVIFGLTAAVSFGVSDYLGGLISRRSGAFTVTVTLQLAAIITFVLVALLMQDPLPPADDVLLSTFIGLLSCIGINLFFYGLSIAKMSVISPVSALTVACVPVIYTFLTEGLPPLHRVAGFALALAAVWLISSGGRINGIDPRIMWIPLTSGMIFGVIFILVPAATDVSRFWSLGITRVALWAFNLLIVRWRSVPLWVNPGDRLLTLLAGVLSAGGSGFFALAAMAGRLDVASVLTNLSPVMPVLLASVLLGERMNRWQFVGMLLALMAIIFISL
jgi:drug/metabolite transporter (DMT)-like permease